MTTISGNINDENVPCTGAELHIGYLLGRHYQSLLPRRLQASKRSMNRDEHARAIEVADSTVNSVKRQKITNIPPEHLHDKTGQVEMSEKCPECNMNFKSVLKHLDKAKKCKEAISAHAYEKLKGQSNAKRKDNVKKYAYHILLECL